MQRIRRTIYRLAALTGIIGLIPSASSFTLQGPFEDWQVVDIGYQLTINGADLLAPKNLGEEYRWSAPVVTYGFDASFMDYFGPEGMAAVDSAMAVFNDLPPVSEWSEELTEFPLLTSRINHTARNLNLIDIKTYVMSAMMEQLGFGAPERWTFCLRSRVVINEVDYYTVIRRNFDPLTYLPTPFVNGTLYTYRIGPVIYNAGIVGYDAREIAIDAGEPNITVASYFGLGGGLIDPRVEARASTFGGYFMGLTRDDAGAIRYALSPFNRNFETAPQGSGLRSTNGIVVTGGGSGGGGSGGSAWTPVSGAVFGPTDPGTGDGTTPVPVAAGFVDGSVRTGVDKVSFVRVDMDPLLGTFSRPFLVRYNESVQTNGFTRTQQVERVLARPDILFLAQDIGTTVEGTPATSERSVNFINNSAISGIGGVESGGPGNIHPSTDITLSRVGPFNRNIRFTTEEQGIEGFMWGTFDGTTNAPIVYPAGRVSLRELERIVLGR